MSAKHPAETTNPYRHAKFQLSVNRYKQLPSDHGIEVAFAGRSNAGKSGAINAITAINNLCRTSKTPGRTQMINFFSIDDTRYLVDLPGYGYAKVPLKIKQHWQKLLERYLLERESLQGVVIIMDVRHPLTEYDVIMLNWCQQSRMPAHVLLTKADKLKRGAAHNTLLKVQRLLDTNYPGTTIQLFSAIKLNGVNDARYKLNHWFGLDEGES